MCIILKETNNFMNGWKAPDHTHSGWVVSSTHKGSSQPWNKKSQECTKQENQSEVVKSNHHGHWMMSFTQLQSNKKIKNKLRKVETRMLKVFISESWFWREQDGTRTVCRHQDQERCSLHYHCCTWQQLTRRNQVTINRFTVVQCTSTQREQTSTSSSECTWTLKQTHHQSGNSKVLPFSAPRIEAPLKFVWLFIQLYIKPFFILF